MRFIHHSSLAIALAFSVSSAKAQEWTPRFDLLTAGAAASVILFQICHGAEAGKRAAAMVSNRLLYEAQTLGPAAQQAYQYASDAYELKIKAMWQTNAELPCPSLARLRSIALDLGFPTPM